MIQEFFLDTNASKKGLYLSQQQIDLLFIVSFTSKEQLENYFYKMCRQFPYQKIEEVIPNYNQLDIEESKRALFSIYQSRLIGYKENHRMSLEEQAQAKLDMMHTPKGQPIPEEVKQEVISIINKKGISEALNYLRNTYGNDFILRFNEFMKDDFENIKSISYEGMEELHDRIKNDTSIDTIIIATSKYDDCIFSNGDAMYYDPFYTAKGLAYCDLTNKKMRFHAIFDYAHLKKLVKDGKGPEDKEEILRDMKNFVHYSLDYIEKENKKAIAREEEPPIKVVEVFNELVEYNKTDSPPYEMAWEKYFGITVDDILSCFEGVQKPKGVEFMYNETQLEEHPDRRRKVSEVFAEIMKKRPDLIDVFGNQMHLQNTHVEENELNPNDSIDAVRGSLALMSGIEGSEYPLPDKTTKKVRTEITEFDIHVCKETYLTKIVPMLKSGELTKDDIILLKKSWIKSLSEEIRNSGINSERITYWSIHDTVDHNLVRANKAILDDNPDMSIEELEQEGKLVDTLYAGALGTREEKQLVPISSEPAHEEQPPKDTEPSVPQTETPVSELVEKKDTPKKLTLKPPTIPNSGYATEFIILGIILAVLITLVILTIGAIT